MNKQDKLITELMVLVQKLRREEEFEYENFNKLKGAIKDLTRIAEKQELKKQQRS